MREEVPLSCNPNFLSCRRCINRTSSKLSEFSLVIQSFSSSLRLTLLHWHLKLLQVQTSYIHQRGIITCFKFLGEGHKYIVVGTLANSQLLKKLKIKMIIINKVIDDAEDKQHIDPYLKPWLGEFKDAVYEAEDLLDEIVSEVQQWEMEAESQTILDKEQDFTSKDKLEEILETLEDLIDEKDAFGLIDDTREKSSYQRTPMTSIPNESIIYGMDADKEGIMKWVVSKDACTRNSNVLAMVGMGGTGKIILAQLVYNDLIRRVGTNNILSEIIY